MRTLKYKIRKNKLTKEWEILTSPDGIYPSGGYSSRATECTTIKELQDKLDCEHSGDKIILKSY